MRGGKKRKFGIKTGGGERSPAASVVRPLAKKFVKGIAKGKKRAFGVKNPVPRGIPGVSGRMESCPEGCPGEYIEGMWVHSKECRWSAVLWRGHGKTEEDWKCPYNCPPQKIASGWTHQWDCAFWDRTGRTPFDHNSPRGAAKVETASGRSVLGKHSTDSGRDSKSFRKTESWQVKRAREKEEAKIFADNLPFFEEDDNDLPF